MDRTNDLLARLTNLPDKEVLELLADDSKIYSEEAVRLAREIALARGLVSNLGEEFKVITAGGRENGPLDVLIIKGLYLKKLINPETLLFVESEGRWLPLKAVFDISRWGIKGGPLPPSQETISLVKEPFPSTAAAAAAAARTDVPVTDTLGAENHEAAKTSEQRLPAFIANNMGDVSAARYRGAGGWLILFSLFLVIWRLYGIWGFQTELQKQPRNVYNFGMTVVMVEYVIGLFAVILLLFESRRAVLFAKAYLIGLLAFNISLLLAAVNWGEAASVLSTDKIHLTSQEHLTGVLKELLLGRFIVIDPSILQTSLVALLVVLGFVYFSVSKRIKATYFDND